MLKKSFFLVLTGILATGCHFFSPPPKNTAINCTALKRQQLYNQTNMNMETNTTLPSQNKALADLIAKNCKD